MENAHNKKGATILLVDDLPDNLFVFSEILKRAGYRVLTARSGEEALAILERRGKEVDLVLSDVMMPKISGFDLCRRIKGKEDIQEIPIILITAQLMDDVHAIEGLEYGADDYISRPVSPSLLCKKIDTVLSRKFTADQWKKRHKATEKRLDAHEWHTRMLIHDLRSPLTSAMGFLSILAMDEDLPDRHKEIISKVQSAIAKESELLEDMLTLTVAKEGRLQLDLESFDLSQSIAEVLFLEEGAAARKGIGLIKEIGLNSTMVQGDRRLISRVITNLLDNAIKYAPHGSTVRVRAFENRAKDAPFILEDVPKGDMVCSIENQGPVISPSSAKKIFDPFVQERSVEQTSCAYGVGLGLAFCREVILCHGGNIGVVSPLPDSKEGAAFYFTVKSAER